MEGTESPGWNPRTEMTVSGDGTKFRLPVEIRNLGNVAVPSGQRVDIDIALRPRAGGDDVDIGIISGDPIDYDADAWFKSSAGVKAVITESISLAYEWFGQKDR